MATMSYDEVLQDYEDVPERMLEPLLPIKTALAEARIILEQDANQIMSQLAARLLPPIGQPVIMKG